MNNQNPELRGEEFPFDHDVEFFTWFEWNDFIRPKKRKPIMVGVCSRTGRIAKIGGLLEALVIQDTYIVGGQCEEAERCWDLRCDLNRTTWESLCRAVGMRRIPRQPEYFAPGKWLNEMEFPEFAEEARKAGHGLLIRKKEDTEP